jgi:hypothetical protein
LREQSRWFGDGEEIFVLEENFETSAANLCHSISE